MSEAHFSCHLCQLQFDSENKLFATARVSLHFYIRHPVDVFLCVVPFSGQNVEFQDGRAYPTGRRSVAWRKDRIFLTYSEQVLILLFAFVGGAFSDPIVNPHTGLFGLFIGAHTGLFIADLIRHARMKTGFYPEVAAI